MSDRAYSRRSRLRGAALAVGLPVGVAAVLVAALSLATNPNPYPAVYDGKAYVRMAGHGFMQYEHVAAPFAHRPAVPAAVHALAKATSLTVPAAFRLLAHASAFLTLCLVYGLARSLGARRRGALIAMVVLALSHYHVRGPLHFYTLIDVETLPVLVLATWALWEGRWGVCLAIAAAGLLAKEWLLVPAVGGVAVGLREVARTRRVSLAVVALAGVGAAAAAFAAPRLAVTASESFSSLDRLGSFERLVGYALDPRRLANVLYVWAAYWLPTLMLVTPDRLRRMGPALAGRRGLLVLHCLLVLGLMLVGGTNAMIFVTYCLPVQAVVLARLVDEAPSPWEIALLVVAALLFNKTWMPVPVLTLAEPARNAWVDFYGGWNGRLTVETALRSLQICGFVALAGTVRFAGARWGKR